MKKVALTAEKRTALGKNPNRRLRGQGKVPAVVYGGKENILLSVDTHDFEKEFKHITENVLIDLSVGGGKSVQVLIKDYQRDPVRGRLVHLDFYEVAADRILHTKVPVHLHGTAAGVKIDGGLLGQMLYEMNVSCLPKDLPDTIEVDISDLRINHSLHVKEIKLPANVVSLESPETVVALVTGKPTEIVPEAEEAAPAEVDKAKK